LKGKSPIGMLLLLTATLAVAALLSLSVGAVSIPAERVVQILRSTTVREVPATDVTIVWDLRLPRILLAGLIGAGLGAAGAGYQGLFRNPLVDPFIIGASSGAALGATLAIVAGLRESLLGMGAVSAAALLGALLAVALVYSIASIGGCVSIPSLLLAGVALSSFIEALVWLLIFSSDDKVITILGWLMGSLSGRGWSVLGSTTPVVLAGALALWLQSRALDSLAFGEETAASLGLRLGRLRVVVVVAASLATAAGVAAGGIIGFVGLVSPHVARLLVGARHALLIPASALVGALLLMLADDLARTIAAPNELPVGVMTALLGSPFFLVLLNTQGRRMAAAP
jgi:iron complex transport system permease protein